MNESVGRPLDQAGLFIMALEEAIESKLEKMLRGFNYERAPEHMLRVTGPRGDDFLWDGIAILQVRIKYGNDVGFTVVAIKDYIARKLVFGDPVGFSGLLENS
jgi:hypothetical protein